MSDNQVVDLEAERYCAACKRTHKLWTLDDKGQPTPTFSRFKQGWQSYCKQQASRINVESQRVRREENQDDLSRHEHELIRKSSIVASELKALKRLDKRYQRGVGVDFTSLMALFEKHDFECVACRSPYPNAAHKVTLENGGCSTEENIIPLCNTCKVTRGHEELDQWAMRTWKIMGLTESLSSKKHTE